MSKLFFFRAKLTLAIRLLWSTDILRGRGGTAGLLEYSGLPEFGGDSSELDSSCPVVVKFTVDTFVLYCETNIEKKEREKRRKKTQQLIKTVQILKKILCRHSSGTNQGLHHGPRISTKLFPEILLSI
jgi:hypothetical protein